MTSAVLMLKELCEQLEECGNEFAFLVGVATSDSPLSERAKIGFLEYSLSSLRRFNELEAKLMRYREACKSS